MRKYFQCLIMLSISFFATASIADLDLQLTRGVIAAIPIAVVPFSADLSQVPGNTSVAAVISNDLSHTGQFRVVNANSPQAVADAQQNTEYWQQQKVSFVVQGQIHPLSGGQFRVDFQLVNVLAPQSSIKSVDNSVSTSTQATADAGSESISRPLSRVLLSSSLTTSSAGLRLLSHRISDMLYQQLTGIKGIFCTRIAYVLVQHPLNQPVIYTLRVADQDGFNDQALLRSYQPIMSPAWSPDGKSIAYVSFENQNAAIYIQDVASGRRKLVSQYPGVNGAPSFSPDGSKLALVLTRTGNPKIYVLDLNSGALTQVTHGYSIDTEPAFSPDGQSLLFTSSRGGTPQVYRYYFATKQVARVTFTGNYNARATFLPGEQGIVMMHRGTGLFGIAKQNLVSSQLQVLTQGGNDESPSLSPNGRMVIYATRYAGRGVLGLVSIDGRVKLRLPAKDGTVQEPAWSPYET